MLTSLINCPQFAHGPGVLIRQAALHALRTFLAFLTVLKSCSIGHFVIAALV